MFFLTLKNIYLYCHHTVTHATMAHNALKRVHVAVAAAICWIGWTVVPWIPPNPAAASLSLPIPASSCLLKYSRNIQASVIRARRRNSTAVRFCTIAFHACLPFSACYVPVLKREWKKKGEKKGTHTHTHYVRSPSCTLLMHARTPFYRIGLPFFSRHLTILLLLLRNK